MSRRIFGVAIGVPVLLLGLAAALALFNGGMAAQAERPGAGAPAPFAGQPAAPAGVWSDIAPFPTIIINHPCPSCTATPVTTPAPPLRLKRAVAVAYPPNDRIYVLGGRHGTDGEDFSLRNIYEYTPGNPGSWTLKSAQLDNAPVGARWTSNMAAALLTDSNGPRLYAIGGSNTDSVPTSTVRIYNPVADSLSVLTTDPWPAGPARLPGGWAVYSNTLYIFGGFSSVGNGGVFTDTWKFNPLAPAGTRWQQIPSANLNLGRGYIASTVLDGYIYAVGGDVWDGVNHVLLPVTNVERLDPSQANPTWQPVASLPIARGDMGAWAYNTGTGYEISGRLAVAGGGFPTPDNQGYLYNPGTNSWAVFPNLVHATRNYGYTQLNGFLYALGGYDFTNTLPQGANWNQRYDATLPILTATATRTATATPTRTPVLVGHVIWQGRPTQPNTLNQLPITLTLKLGTGAINYPNQMTDASGFFTVPVGTLANGVYTWWAKGPPWLATTGSVTLAGAPVTQQEMGLQPAGDVDNSNLVDVADFTLLRNTFGLACGHPSYDGRADYTGDCLIDIADFTLHRGNFGQAGPPQPTGPEVARRR